MLTRRNLLGGTAAVTLPISSLPVEGVRAQAVDLLKIFVPAAPGGGWDQTARTIEQVLRATGAVKGVQITNVGGAGGTVGLPQFLNQWKGQGNALMVAGMVMIVHDWIDSPSGLRERSHSPATANDVPSSTGRM